MSSAFKGYNCLRWCTCYKDVQPFQPAAECIVVPRTVLSGLLTALHIRFNHPIGTRYQTSQSACSIEIFPKYWQSNQDSLSCRHCQPLKTMKTKQHICIPNSPPTHTLQQMPIKWCYQLILVLYKTISYTMDTVTESEKHVDRKNALLIVSGRLWSWEMVECCTQQWQVSPSHGIKLEHG